MTTILLLTAAGCFLQDLAFLFLLSRCRLVDEEEEESGVEDGVEDPGADAVAPAALGEVEEEHGEVADEVAAGERRLEAQHQQRSAPEGRRQPDADPEPVAEDDGLH